MSKYVSILVVVSALSGGQVAAEQWIQWTEAEGGNDHWYRLTAPDLTWTEAEEEAVLAGGHLVTINDSAENDWVRTNFIPGPESAWIGHHQDCDDPKCPDDPCEPAGCWKWSSGESAAYTNWRSGEPNDDGGLEDFVTMSLVGEWNDTESPTSVGRGIIERDTEPPAIPAVSTWGLTVFVLLLLGAGTLVMARRKPAVV